MTDNLLIKAIANEGGEIKKDVIGQFGFDTPKNPKTPQQPQAFQNTEQDRQNLREVYGGDEAASKIGQIPQMNEADEKLRRQQWKLLTGKDMIKEVPNPASNKMRMEHHQAAESLGEQPPEPPETPEQPENPPGPKIPEEEVLPSFEETAALPTGRKTGLNLKFQRKSNVRRGAPEATEKIRGAETRADHGVGG